jgi:hexokinase
LAASKALFAKQHPSTYKPTTVDLAALRKLASYISMRSSALIAASLYALWDVRIDSHKAVVAGLPESSHLRQGAEADLDLKKTMVAFNGSVIENYPGYLASCQRFVDELVENTGRAENGSIELVAAKESSLLGAAVASACAKRN